MAGQALAGALGSSAAGINDAGVIVGTSTSPLGWYDGNTGFVYVDGEMLDLNLLTVDRPSDLVIISATAINANGQITGTALTSRGLFHAFQLTPIVQDREAVIESDMRARRAGATLTPCAAARARPIRRTSRR